MHDMTWCIAYERDGKHRRIEHEGFEPFMTSELEVCATRDGDAFALSCTALCDVSITSVEVRIRRPFAPGETVLLNGYQSWTDTHERDPHDKMVGLGRLPRGIVERHVLDGSGDYRFTDYPAKSGLLHGWTYLVIRGAGGVELVASLDESDGFTLLRTNAREGFVSVVPECPARCLAAGERTVLARFAVIAGRGDEVYSTWMEMYGCTPRSTLPVTGYSSWYRHYADIDEGKIASDLAGATRAFAALEAHQAVKLFQVDDGWCKVGDWLEVDAAKFPHGLAALAQRIREAGFAPGLWLAPFVCERASRTFRNHPDWLLRDGSGAPVRAGSHWSGSYALDVRNGAVRDYIARCLRTLTCDWGFSYLKLDFLYAACMVCHDGMNRGQLMADAIALVRESVADDVLIDGCGVPLASAFGTLDYCRVGCDVGLDWNDKPHMRLTERERPSTKNSLASTLARGPLDGRAFGCDPDVVLLRPEVSLTEDQRARILAAASRHASVLLTSDDMGAWDAGQLAAFQVALDALCERKRAEEEAR